MALGAIGYVQRDRCGVDPEDTLGALLEQRRNRRQLCGEVCDCLLHECSQDRVGSVIVDTLMIDWTPKNTRN